MNAKTMRPAALLALLGTAALLAAALSVLSLTSAEDASATVPPRNCGIIGAGGKRFQIKADQMRCRTARATPAAT